MFQAISCYIPPDGVETDGVKVHWLLVCHVLSCQAIVLGHGKGPMPSSLRQLSPISGWSA